MYKKNELNVKIVLTKVLSCFIKISLFVFGYQ